MLALPLLFPDPLPSLCTQPLNKQNKNKMPIESNFYNPYTLGCGHHLTRDHTLTEKDAPAAVSCQ